MDATPGPAVSIAALLNDGSLQAHYQPIARLSDGEVIAHESLIRLPSRTWPSNPDQFFAEARRQGVLVQAEQACLDEGIRSWVRRSDKPLFLNLSVYSVIEMMDRLGAAGVVGALAKVGVAPQSLTIEITEHDHVANMSGLIQSANEIRAYGIRFALDDFGDGRSSLRLWSELRPDYVKLDKYFCIDADTNAVKVQTLRGLQRFAEIFGTQLIAEGIETASVLRVVRDLGLPYGQGYFLGLPAPAPAAVLTAEAMGVLRESQIAVLPEPTRAGGGDVRMDRIRTWVKPEPVCTTVNALASLFAENSALYAIALVEESKPVGLVSRQSFIDQCAHPYFRDLYGKDNCLQFANRTPLMVERYAGIDAMMAVLTSADQSYLTEGLIVTENGHYAGLARGDQLVRMVTEVRIEAARHANPLTFLPGNIPINQHIARLLEAGHLFVACYADLNNFKPFNDHYGYWQGDEMIRLAAKTLVACADPKRDFVGHVGGDDFLVLFQSPDWEARCLEILRSFDQLAMGLYDESARLKGGIESEDRHGVMRFFPLTTIAIGAVVTAPGRFSKPDEVANAAAAAKHKAKSLPGALAVDRPMLQVVR